MQRAYITALYDLMKADPQVCSLLSDSGTEYDEMMAAEFPSQCFNFGIAEQNQVAAAAGMASCGKIPFVYTSSAFLIYRAFEFVRNDVCLQNQNVKLVGMGSGTAWRTLGASHHTTEELALLRVLPNLTVLSPATPLEVRTCVRRAYEIEGPVYIRLAMGGEPEFFDEGAPLKTEEIPALTRGEDVVVFTTGSILCEVMSAAKKLGACGVRVTIAPICQIKPMNETAVRAYAEKAMRVCVVEEHNILGGLGSAIAEVLLESGRAIPFKRIGLQDCFAVGYGTQLEVREQNGLDSENITRKILEWIKETK